MKRFWMFLSLLIVASMILSNLVWAANPDNVTFTATLDKETINVSDEDQTVVVSVAVENGKKIDLDGIGATVLCAEQFATTVSNSELTFSTGDYNSVNGIFGWSHDFSTEFVTVNNIMTITYTIPANTPAGTYELGIKDLEITKDWGESWEEGGVVTTTLTIVDSSVPQDPTWTKVTSAPSDWSGTYLIVYEDKNFIFDGSLEALDASNNYCSVTITDSTITAPATYAFTIAAIDDGYSIQSAGGYYIGNTSDANKLCSDTSIVYTNTISLNDDGTVDIISAGSYLRFNSASNNMRFRYYKSATYANQKAICLYKLVELHTCAHDHYDDITETTHQSYCSCGEKIGEPVAHTYENYVCACGAKFTGWVEKVYYKDAVMQTGWVEIDGAWYYLDPTTGIRAEGLTRVPYPTVAINGVTYAPDAETIAYCEGKGIEFIDANEAWFLFGEDGKFAYDTDGDIGWYAINGANEIRYMNHGMLAWHPGLIENGEDYYYFIGDVTNGGNIAADGDTYITRNNGIEAFKIGTIYNFADGKLSGVNGIVTEGTVKKYYENSRLMTGNGLTKVTVDGETKYIYVRSNGQLVVNAEYYVPANDLGIVSTLYQFDENGYLVAPKSTGVNGIVDGYYYENGKIAYGAGLIEYNGGYIYVRSSGKVATGTYWVTNANTDKTGYEPGKYEFDENGKMLAVKDGIVEVNGVLYYYENNCIIYGAGLIEYNGGYIYVRSNGMVAVGEYWITTTNGLMEAGKYIFDENGMMITE